MKTIIFGNQKGGVGKTTTCYNVAAGFARRGRRVLVVDLDPQMNLSSTAGCDGDLIARQKTLYRVFLGDCSVADALQKLKNFDLLTVGIEATAADMQITRPGREHLLKAALSEIADNYDLCFIDTAPTLGVLLMNGLVASDGVIVPLTVDDYAIQALDQFFGFVGNVKQFSNPELLNMGLLITKYNGRLVISQSLESSILAAAASEKTRVFDSRIRDGVAVRESQALKEDIFNSRSAVADDYNEFIDEIEKELKIMEG